jgi:hypothetical protein
MRTSFEFLKPLPPLLVSLIVLVGCGSSTQSAEGAPDVTAVPTAEPGPTARPMPTATAAPTAAEVDTGSFAAAPTAEISGSTIRLTYEGATYTLSESALIPAGKSFALRFQQPAADGGHVIKLTPSELKAGEPAKLDGKAALFFQVTEGKTTDGAWKVVDITGSCKVAGTITVAEIPKAGGKAKGSIDIAITCENVEKIRTPIAIKGDFSNVPLGKK